MKYEGLTNRTVWITGADSGVGHALASALARARNYVFVSACEAEKLWSLKQAHPENVFVLPMDVNSGASLAAAEKTLREQTDHLDTLICCEGACEYDDGPQLSTDMFERVTQANYLGAVATVRIALPLLRQSNNRPHIAALSSLAALLPFPRAAAYGASKAALEYFLQSLRVDIRDDNIDVSIVRSGLADSAIGWRNDFAPPASITSQNAAEQILSALSKRKMFADFPRKMAVPLKLLRLAPVLWMKTFAPKFRKSQLL